jgi:hypothetical protein
MPLPQQYALISKPLGQSAGGPEKAGVGGSIAPLAWKAETSQLGGLNSLAGVNGENTDARRIRVSQ